MSLWKMLQLYVNWMHSWGKWIKKCSSKITLLHAHLHTDQISLSQSVLCLSYFSAFFSFSPGESQNYSRSPPDKWGHCLTAPQQCKGTEALGVCPVALKPLSALLFSAFFPHQAYFSSLQKAEWISVSNNKNSFLTHFSERWLFSR